MNRLSLLGGALPSNPKQNIKQAAFLQYFKSFAQNGLETLQKLQKQFNKHCNRRSISQDFKVFQKIKTLISSYEVFILEMNDSCEFIQVPQFGTCLLKVFIQLIGILNWSLQHLAIQKKAQLITFQPTLQNISSGFNQSMGYSFSSASHSRNRRESNMMRNTFNGTLNFDTLSKQIRCFECSNKANNSPHDIYKIKEQTTMQLKDINEQISRISKEYTEQQKKIKKQDLQRDKLQKFIQKRQEQGKTLLNIGLGQQSKNEQILTQILYTLNRKGEAIKKFADLRMTSLGQSNRIQTVTEEEYESFKEQISLDLVQKVSLAKHKLAHLFKQHLIQHQKIKRQKMVDAGTQIQEQQSMRLHKLFHQKVLKNIKLEIIRLQKQLEFQRNLNEGMKRLLQDKCIQYEGEVMKYRNELINMEIKSKKDLKSTRKIKYEDQNAHKRAQRLAYPQRKSLNFIDLNGQEQSYLKSIDEDSSDEEISINKENSRALNKSFLQTGKRLSKSRNAIKFKQIIQKSNQFQISRHVFNEVIYPNPQTVNTQLTIKKNPILPDDFDLQVNTTRITNSSVQTQSDLLQNYIALLFNSQQRFAKTQHQNKTQKQEKILKYSTQFKNRTNLVSYTKNNSGHMRDLTNCFQPQKLHKKNSSLLDYSKLMSKSSKFLQRAVKFNTVQGYIKSDFTPINLTEDSKKKKFYKKNYADDFEQDFNNKNVILERDTLLQIPKHQIGMLNKESNIKFIKPQNSEQTDSQLEQKTNLQNNPIKNKAYHIKNTIKQSQRNLWQQITEQMKDKIKDERCLHEDVGKGEKFLKHIQSRRLSIKKLI